PLEREAIALAANLRENATRDALETLAARDEVVVLQRPAAYLAAAAAGALLAKIVEYLETFTRAQPWVLGATSIALARELAIDESTLVRILGQFVENGRLARRSGYFSTLEHQPALTPRQREMFDALVPAGDGRTFVPVPFANVRNALKGSQIEGALAAFDTLLARGALVKVGDDLYRGSQIAAIRARVERYLHERRQMTAAAFRDLLGTSRKYAVPLLEWLDAQGVTLRVNDYRVLRTASRGQSMME
ncbi:MAG: SelB C-terminal domain-containing protein, partial [Candidatus Eremiobacteraeota bacterium]|nr:SelB C-terminal domain-containing protein [Candidatus Eremiobacteraeota bacterium]